MQRFAFLGSAAVFGLASVFLTTAPGQNKAPSGDTIEKITQALPDKALAKPKQPRKLLIFSKTSGFRHASIAVGAKALTMLGEKTGAYTAWHTESEAFFEPDVLKTFDAVVFLNTTSEPNKNDPFRVKNDTSAEAKQREEKFKKSLVDFVSSGKGLIGIHAACDTYHNWKDFNVMMGGAFVSHPWGATTKGTVIKNVDPNNPINAAFDGKGFDIVDEIYVFRNDTALPTERRFLLTLDETKMDTTKGKRADGLYPISWIANYGKGHTFYCSLGHNDYIYYNPAILKHYLAGIQFAMGDLQTDATPIPITLQKK